MVRWDDLIRGDSHIDCASLSDPVLVREDGSYLYTLPSVVDDIDAGVTHIIRGEDHVTNTAVQIQLFCALGAEAAPHFAHHNLLIGADGQGLSKRSGALSIAGLREAGVESLAVAAMAVLTGSSQAVQPVHSLPELAGLFDLSSISRNSARFDDEELRRLSQHVLHGLPYEFVRERLEASEIVGCRAERLWLAARGNLEKFSDISDWWQVIEGAVGSDLRPKSSTRVFATRRSRPCRPSLWTSRAGASGRRR